MSIVRLSQVIRRPVVSEKASLLGSDRWYVFRVLVPSTKRDIRRSVEIVFGVAVERVNVVNVRGKSKKFGKTKGKGQDFKKAYVRLKAGSVLNLPSA